MLATVWRFFVALLDWKTTWRILTGKPVIDTVFVTNMRDDIDRNRFLGKWRPKEGHFNGPRYWLNGSTAGRTRALDITTDEMATIEGRIKAKRQFIAATRWGEKHGAKVVLLAAATKRLFWEDELTKLKNQFPNLIFTIGDNGTVLLLVQETIRALRSAGLNPGFSRIAILGPYGYLGEVITKTLTQMGYEIVGAGPNSAGLKQIAKKYNIAVCESFDKMGKVDAVIACTHSADISLTADVINSGLIRRNEKKLLVVDVAEPSNLRHKEWAKCKDFVLRQDAGNGYAPGLKYVLDAISYRMFRLTKGVTFGCFAEALCLASAMKRGENIDRDWIAVNSENMDRVEKLFKYEGFKIPSPRCFGRPVESFDLSLPETKELKHSWKLTERIASLFF